MLKAWIAWPTLGELSVFLIWLCFRKMSLENQRELAAALIANALVCFSRADLLRLYEQVVLTDIEFSDSQNVDQALWKNIFYQVIERFRQLLKDPTHENIDNIRNILLTLLDEVGVWAGCTDFANMKLQKTNRSNRDLEAVMSTSLCCRVHCSLIRCCRSYRHLISLDWRTTWTAWLSGLDPYAKR